MGFPTSSYHLKRLALIWLCVAGIIVLLVVSRWVGGGFGLAAGIENESLSVVNAAQTLFLAQAFLISLFLKFVPNSSRLLRNISGILLPVVLLLQHRTVWIAALVSTLFAAVQNGKIRRVFLRVLIGAIVVGAILGLVVFGENIGKIPNSLSDSTVEALDSEDSTFMWRVEGWKALLTERSKLNYIDYLFGRPFGAGYIRKVWDTERTEAPHNFYVQTFLRLGGLGLIALVCIYVILLRSLANSTLHDTSGYLSNALMYILVITQLIYFIPYSPHYEQGIILGLAVALSMKHNEGRDEQAREA